MERSFFKKFFSGERGSGLVEVLVVLGIETTIIGLAISSYWMSSRQLRDQSVIERTDEQARGLAEIISFDLRMLGAGMPLGQINFPIGDLILGDATMPIRISATASHIEFRINEVGQDTVLTSSFTPDASNTTFNVSSAVGFKVGDTIYISDMPQGGATGLQGTITGISGNSITIDTTYVTSSGASFVSGSIVNRVKLVTYDSPADGSGITRDSGTGAEVLAPNSVFDLTYLDSTGTALVLPLTEAIIKDELSGIRLNVTVENDRPLHERAEYQASFGQTVALRNLIYSR